MNLLNDLVQPHREFTICHLELGMRATANSQFLILSQPCACLSKSAAVDFLQRCRPQSRSGRKARARRAPRIRDGTEYYPANTRPRWPGDLERHGSTPARVAPVA